MTIDQFRKNMADLGLDDEQTDFLLDMHELRLSHGMLSNLNALAGLIELLVDGGERIEDTINRGILRGDILP